MNALRIMLLAGAGLAIAQISAAVDEPSPLRVAPGFKVSVFADENLANDTYAMTLDSRGRVVVTTRGFIRSLHDDDGDGKADRAETFASTETGGMGLCFDGDDLMFCGDGYLSRYRDANGDGKADGPAEKLYPLAYGEHGGHAMRKGPDGYWYVIGGNDAKIDKRHVKTPDPVIADPEAGCLLRISPDFKTCEIVAQGFRNPYDFDINANGDAFLYDSDVERDFFLPWYSPTRLYHVGVGGHHGWRVTGYLRCWCRKPYYLDTVDILESVGRGSPTGVTVYRHSAFPKKYQGGVFYLDWTFGKAWFAGLTPGITSYHSRSEAFLEPTGTDGFAPTDVCVAPDGALFVSIGGRKTRGAIYRVEYVGPKEETPPLRQDLDRVLRAPQPLDAWSRAIWEPLADKLGREAFEKAATEGVHTEEERMRALEILVERFGGASRSTLEGVARIGSRDLSARAAWAASRSRPEDAAESLKLFTRSSYPRVRLAILEALLTLPREALDGFEGYVGERLNDGEKRVRQAAAKVATRLPDASRTRLNERASGFSDGGKLAYALAELWRRNDPRSTDDLARVALDVFRRRTEPEYRIDALRIMIMSLGDWALFNPPTEAWTAYAASLPLKGRETLVGEMLPAIRAAFPTGIEELDDEIARVLAMLEDDSPETLAKVFRFLSNASTPTRDVHFLVVLSRLKAAWSPEQIVAAAGFLSDLDRKLQGKESRIKQTWNTRLAEIVGLLSAKAPGLPDAIIERPDFVKVAHASWALGFDPSRAARSARMFLEKVKSDSEFPPTGEVLELIGRLPLSEIRGFLRDRWDDLSLRDDVILKLSQGPEEADREKFRAGLESNRPEVVDAAFAALETLPGVDSAESLAPAFRLLRRLTTEPREAKLRARTAALIARQSGRPISIREIQTDPTSLRAIYQPIFDREIARRPGLKSLIEPAEPGAETWSKLKPLVDWASGDPKRGADLFRTRGCLNCHTGTRSLGPDLAGATGRFSLDDLFTAIVSPNRDVAPAFRATLVETRDGRVHSGLVMFESADGLIVQTGATSTVRLDANDIVSRRVGARSMMPEGLLVDLKPGDLADLYAYLRTLK